jgi:endogenous inhibitor of DNA gyrase (YacG/DUF329 family)
MAAIRCPICGAATRWATDNVFRPFCSERCKLIDLGAWASDRYGIAGPAEGDGPDTPPPPTATSGSH